MPNVGDLIKALLGKDVTQLKQAGEVNYPSTPLQSQHHQEAARIMGEKFGFIPSQLAGTAMEALEWLPGLAGLSTPTWEDTRNDFIANWRGGLEGSQRMGGQFPAKPGAMVGQPAGIDMNAMLDYMAALRAQDQRTTPNTPAIPMAQGVQGPNPGTELGWFIQNAMNNKGVR